MLERVILHIGLHKTGSSSIQASLEGYDDGDCFYADLGWINHSIPIYTAFSQNSNQYHVWTKQGASIEQVQDIKEQSRHKLEEQLSRSSRNTMIISGEDLSQLMPSEANAFVAFLRERCKDIRAVAYVRDPLDYSASAFQQLVKGGCKAIPSIIGQNIEVIVNNWEQALGPDKVDFRAFSRKALHNGCVVQDFCRTANLDSDRIRLKRRNESLSGVAIKILFHLNHTSPLQFGDVILARARRRLINILSSLFGDQPGINKHLLTNHVDPRDIEYMKSANLTKGLSRPVDASAQLTESLAAWLEYLDPVIHARLSEWLAEKSEVVSWGGSTSELIHRVYYEILRIDIISANGNMLAKSALDLYGSSSDNIKSSIALLELAHRGKPFNKRIKQALQELRQVQE